MFKRTRVFTGLMAAFGGSAVLLSAPALAQQTEGNLGRVEVTGSAIKRVQVEGPSPVEIITKEDIKRSGATSINELVRSIAALDIYNDGELSSNSPSGSGTANIRLRGLTETDVLVLLNGRRLAINALHDGSGAGAAVDINMIPISAIERIDILKDGASAIYGADAVAGVFNVITRSDYTGKELALGAGTASRKDGEEYTANFTAGFGDLATNKFNILASIDYFKREPIFRKDRKSSNSVDFRRDGSGDFRSSFSPFGNYLLPDFSDFSGEQVRPCPAANFDPEASLCRYDFNSSILTAYNGADRLTGLLLGSFAVTPNLTLKGEFIGAQAEDTFKAHPVPDFFFDPNRDLFYAGRFMQGGPRTTERESKYSQFALGAEGVVLDAYDWKAFFSQGTSRVTNSDSNYYDSDRWNAALEAGLIDATRTDNDAALVESLKVRPVRTGKSQIRSLDAQVSGPIFSLPSGDLKFAVGASAWKETLVDTPDLLTQQGLVVGSIAQAPVDAERDAKAVFGELSIPILKNLEAQVALRYDRYQTSGSETSPKFALRYEPMPSLALRASYTESFKAPRLKQLFGATEEGAITIRDADSCTTLTGDADCEINAFETQGSNRQLKAEKGKTWNVGIIFEPVNSVSVGLDWWRIRKSNNISEPTISSAIEQGLWVLDTSQNPPRYRVFTNLQNIADRETEGVDLDLRGEFRVASLGTVRVRNALTYMYKNRTKDQAEDEWAEFSGTYATPRIRNVFVASAEIGPWEPGMSVTYMGGFWDSDLPLNDGAMDARKVPGYEEVGVRLAYTGFKGFRLSGGIQNIFDRMPPFSAQNASDNAYSQMGFAELYTNRGRFYYVTASYEF